jgi:acrylyl-CoA reductase (NADPH)/3-hydroxypropionyl-CoA dehydratase/3-hydroxypropionyl-CoA synthetase
VLNLGTVVRALFTTLRIEPGRTMLVEGAATGRGWRRSRWRRATASRRRDGVERRARGGGPRRRAAGTLDRRDPRVAHLFTPVPEGADAIRAWLADGTALEAALREAPAAGWRLRGLARGATAFPRSFQLLADGGTLTFYGASSGYHFTFAGKPGRRAPADALRAADARAGETALVYYGPGADADGLVDATGLELVEAAAAAGLRLCVAAYTDAQRDFVLSLGFGDAVRGVVSLEELARRGAGSSSGRGAAAAARPAARHGALPRGGAALPGAHGQAVRAGGGTGAPRGRRRRGAPDLVVEARGPRRARRVDVARPAVHRARRVRRGHGRPAVLVLRPAGWTGSAASSCPRRGSSARTSATPYEVARMNRMIDAGQLEVTPPVVVDWTELPAAHQAMWDNRHAGATYVCNHALPSPGLRTRDELYEAWAGRPPPRRSRRSSTDATTLHARDVT